MSVENEFGARQCGVERVNKRIGVTRTEARFYDRLICGEEFVLISKV